MPISLKNAFKLVLSAHILVFDYPVWEAADNLNAVNMFGISFSLVVCVGVCVPRRETRRSEWGLIFIVILKSALVPSAL